MPESIIVFVVDSDESILRAMARLMRANGFDAVCLQNMEALLQQDLPSSGAVILLDVKTSRQYAETLQKPFQAQGLSLPVIYLTDCDTDRMRREAKGMGAAGYFRKPVDEQALADAITFAVRQLDSGNPDGMSSLSCPLKSS